METVYFLVLVSILNAGWGGAPQISQVGPFYSVDRCLQAGKAVEANISPATRKNLAYFCAPDERPRQAWKRK